MTKKKHATGYFYVLKRITKFFIDHGKRDQFIRAFSYFWWFYLIIKNNIKLVGIKNLPKKGPYILAGNHSSALDAIILMSAMCGVLGKRVYYIANIRDFQKDNIQRYFHMLYEGKPRKGSGDELVKMMGDWLLEGKIVAIPPEGMYNKGKIMKGYTGITRIYHYANDHSEEPIPIIPACTIGADIAYPPFPNENGEYIPKRSGVIARVGKPIYLERPKELTKEIIRQQTDSIMDKIANMALQNGVVESWILKEKTRGKKRQY